MRSRATLLCVGSVLPGMVLAVHGCRAPTQVTLDIGTNVACTDLRGTDIFVASAAHDAEERAALLAETIRIPSAVTSECLEGPTPRPIGTLVITPSASTGAVVVVAAFGRTRPADCKAPRFGPECIVARRQFAFIDHLSVTLPIVLDPSCAGVPCNENSTCVGKKCVGSSVDCSSGTCAEPGTGGADEVDGASPLLDGATLVDAADASDGAPLADGGDAGDGGVVVGATCPQPVTCSDATVSKCTSAALPMCCYGGGATVCTEPGKCAFMSSCCRSSDDCGPDDVCCASTAIAGPGTTITCRKPADCLKTSGFQRVCAAPGPTGCGPGRSCDSVVYSTNPDFFACS